MYRSNRRMRRFWLDLRQRSLWDQSGLGLLKLLVIGAAVYVLFNSLFREGGGCSASKYCSGNGECLLTSGNDVLCVCNEGHLGSDCSLCSPGHFGPQCEHCECVHGDCDDGIDGTGECVCRSDYYGEDCSIDGIHVLIPFLESDIVEAVSTTVNSVVSSMAGYDDDTHCTERLYVHFLTTPAVADFVIFYAQKLREKHVFDIDVKILTPAYDSVYGPALYDALVSDGGGSDLYVTAAAILHGHLLYPNVKRVIYLTSKSLVVNDVSKLWNYLDGNLKAPASAQGNCGIRVGDLVDFQNAMVNSIYDQTACTFYTDSPMVLNFDHYPRLHVHHKAAMWFNSSHALYPLVIYPDRVHAVVNLIFHDAFVPWPSDFIRRGACEVSAYDKQATHVLQYTTTAPWDQQSCESRATWFQYSSVFCAERCSFHGECLWNDTSSCQCDSGYSGPTCAEKADTNPFHCTRATCNYHGECNSIGQCQCDENWGGATCSIFDDKVAIPEDRHVLKKVRRCNPALCGYHGQCSRTGECICFPGWVGTNCNMTDIVAIETLLRQHGHHKVCTPSTCNYHGNCTSQGDCVCDDEWTGPTCSYPNTRRMLYDCGHNATCSSHGVCLSTEGRCECDAGFIGKHCELADSHVQLMNALSVTEDSSRQGFDAERARAALLSMKDSQLPVLSDRVKHCHYTEYECTGHGTCNVDTGICECDSGWTGTACAKCVTLREDEIHINPATGEIFETCSGHGRCSGGHCTCDPGWDGPDCSRCAKNFYGRECRPCQCSRNAIRCEDGIHGDGTCVCDPILHSGSRCEEERIHIIMCFDGAQNKFSNFLRGLSATLQSIQHNADRPDLLFFHLLTLPDHAELAYEFVRDLDERSVALFEIGIFNYGRVMSYYMDTGRLFNPLVLGHHLYISNVFPALDKAIIIDTDVIVLADIAELWNMDMEGKPIIAYEMCRVRYEESFNMSHPVFKAPIRTAHSKSPIHYGASTCTFSNGVIVVNISMWNTLGYTEVAEWWSLMNMKYRGSLLTYLTEGKDYTKSLMNLAVNENYKKISHNWNKGAACYLPRGVGEDEWKILHFSGRAKPWQDASQVECTTRDIWYTYANSRCESYIELSVSITEFKISADEDIQYFIVLECIPGNGVVVEISTRTTLLSIVPATVEFTEDNWNIPQLINVHGGFELRAEVMDGKMYTLKHELYSANGVKFPKSTIKFVKATVSSPHRASANGSPEVDARPPPSTQTEDESPVEETHTKRYKKHPVKHATKKG